MSGPTSKLVLKVESGDKLKALLREVAELSSFLVRPVSYHFRVSNLQTGTPRQTDDVSLSSDYRFVCFSVEGWLESLVADTANVQIAQHAYYNIESSSDDLRWYKGDGMPFTKLGSAFRGAATPYWVPSKEKDALAMPYIFSEGSDITVYFAAEAGFGSANDHIAEIFLNGFLVHKNLRLESEIAELVLRSLKRG